MVSGACFSYRSAGCSPHDCQQTWRAIKRFYSRLVLCNKFQPRPLTAASHFATFYVCVCVWRALKEARV